jgi:phage terminase small subunit
VPNPRKPTALKLLQGNPGKRRLPENEPQPEIGATRPPGMTREAREVWDELAPMLTSNRVLSEMDAIALAHLCNLEANRRELSKMKDRARAPGDAVFRVEVMKEERKLSPALAAMFGRFGMTPSDRSRVRAEAAPKKSGLARFLGEG